MLSKVSPLSPSCSLLQRDEIRITVTFVDYSKPGVQFENWSIPTPQVLNITDVCNDQNIFASDIKSLYIDGEHATTPMQFIHGINQDCLHTLTLKHLHHLVALPVLSNEFGNLPLSLCVYYCNPALDLSGISSISIHQLTIGHSVINCLYLCDSLTNGVHLFDCTIGKVVVLPPNLERSRENSRPTLTYSSCKFPEYLKMYWFPSRCSQHMDVICYKVNFQSISMFSSLRDNIQKNVSAYDEHLRKEGRRSCVPRLNDTQPILMSALLGRNILRLAMEYVVPT
jgi:hypothetical protein